MDPYWTLNTTLSAGGIETYRTCVYHQLCNSTIADRRFSEFLVLVSSSSDTELLYGHTDFGKARGREQCKTLLYVHVVDAMTYTTHMYM